MADPLSIAAGTIAAISSASQIANKIITTFRRENLDKLPWLADLLRRLQLHVMLFDALSSNIEKSLSENADDSLFKVVASIHRKLEAVAKITSFEGKGILSLLETRVQKELEKGIDTLAEDVRLLCDLHHTSILHDVREELDKMKDLAQSTAKFSLESSQVAFDRIDHGLATLRSDFAQVFSLSNNSDDRDENSQQRQEALDSVRQRLYDQLGGLKMPSLVFPFNLASQCSDASDELPTRRVKLDTGAHDNWIRSSVLERWGIKYDPMDDPKTYVGAGGGGFQSLGCVTLFWYSINKAKTTESVFLIHDDLPFDAIMGSRYILTESMDTFAEGVLPLVHMIPKDELRTLRDTATARGVENEEIRKIQRAQKAREREENRQTKAASRAHTRAGTPGAATPIAGLLYPTVSHAGTSRTTMLSNTPLSGTTPRGSGTSTPAASADP
ncbi:hypothetical protein BJ166DRAFT_532281 [Pestalotiopsis sp. NC0098]|nr:hypothetical protein BJ166DRAFT_532281 [Pestalotiopsis sp. NC0098]